MNLEAESVRNRAESTEAVYKAKTVTEVGPEFRSCVEVEVAVLGIPP